ncbi:TPR repeat-containing protein, partial [Reticulomyxa filosa]
MPIIVIDEAHFNEIVHSIEKNDPQYLSLDLSNLNLTDTQLKILEKALKDNKALGHIKWGTISANSNSIIHIIESKLESNNKIYSYYPTDYIYALLSNHAYYDQVEERRVEFKDNATWTEHLKDWKIVKIHEDTKSGYYGILYKNPTMHQIVLTHRGTNVDWRDLLQTDSDIHNDIEGILKGNIVSQQAQAYEATKEAVEWANEKHYHLSITGHSLGAWLAELSVYFCWTDFAYREIKAVTFDSPGSEPMMEKFKSSIKNNEAGIDIRDLDITSYLSFPNPINSCNKHVGKYEEVLDWPVMSYHGSSYVSMEEEKVDGSPLCNWIKSTTLSSIVSVIGDLINGNVDQSQYWKVFEYYKDGKIDDAKQQKEFEQLYEAHYKVKAVNESRELLGKSPVSLDSCLEKLARNKSNIFLLTNTQEESYKHQLQSIEKRYNIEQEDDKTYLIGIGDIAISDIKQQLQRLLDVYPELKKQICDINAPISKQGNNSCSFTMHLTALNNSHFVKRLDIEEKIKAGFNTGEIVIMSGFGGTGKSTIAAMYGEDAEKNGTLVRWFEAASKTKLEAGYRELATDLNLYIAGMDAKLMMSRVNNKLSKCTQDKMFIFNNIEQYEYAQEYIERLPNRTKILLTTRNSNLHYKYESIIVEPFSKIEARDYVNRTLNITSDDNALLVEAVNLLPFRLNQSVAYLKKHPTCNITQFIKLYNDKKDTDIYPEADFLFKDLINADPDAWVLLRHLAFLDPDYIPLSLLDELVQALNLTIEYLRNQSLIEVVSNGDGLKLHRLVQIEVIQYKGVNLDISLSNNSIVTTLSEKLNNLLPPLDGNPDSAWDQSKLLIEHVTTLCKLHSGSHPDVAASLNNIGVVYDSLGDYSQALKYYEESLKMKQELYPGNHPSLADSLNNIGTVYNSLGDYSQALKYHEESLKMKQELYPGNHPSLADSLNNIGAVYDSLGDYNQALKYHEESLKMKQELYLGNHPSLADSLNNIGV